MKEILIAMGGWPAALVICAIVVGVVIVIQGWPSMTIHRCYCSKDKKTCDTD